MLRPPDTVMRLARMGSMFPTRLSFMRLMLGTLASGGWRISRPRFDLDGEGRGVAIYRVAGPERTYSLVCFSTEIAAADRSDRVIAEVWDATFALVEGDPGEADVARLAAEVPRQEAGRYLASELVLCRANRSVRFFRHVVERLAAGLQPDRDLLVETGYLMRTTAVYGNGKFGIADRFRIAGRPEFSGPFQAEMLAVYLVRAFSIDLVEHVAAARNSGAARLAPALKTHLGVGNATGLGMAPFLMSHPELLDRWMRARETALARGRALPTLVGEALARFRSLLARARRHVAEWRVEDEHQMRRIIALRADLAQIEAWVAAQPALSHDALYRKAEAESGLEAQEMVASLIIESAPEVTDGLAASLSGEETASLDAAMPVAELGRLIAHHYDWTARTDTDDPRERRLFWYVSEDKLEPRLGLTPEELGQERERPFAIVHDMARLRQAIAEAPTRATVAELALRHPELRHLMRRVQTVARRPYGEIHDNLVGASCLPIDLLRCKLAMFGASKFDPKSDRWTRVTLFQGAPLPDALSPAAVADWAFPALA